MVPHKHTRAPPIMVYFQRTHLLIGINVSKKFVLHSPPLQEFSQKSPIIHGLFIFKAVLLASPIAADSVWLILFTMHMVFSAYYLEVIANCLGLKEGGLMIANCLGLAREGEVIKITVRDCPCTP